MGRTLQFNPRTFLVTVACAGLLAPACFAQLSVLQIATGFDRPTHLTVPPNDTTRVFVVEQSGRIKIIRTSDNTVLATPFLDLSAKTTGTGERGLFALAFHPDYASNGLFFVHYTDLVGDTVIERYQVSDDPNIANPAGQGLFMTFDQTRPNHNGGMIAFKPADPNHYLYIALGDGGGGGDPDANAQNLTTTAGAINRIDVDAGIPADPLVPNAPPSNPFVDGPGGNADSIWAYGLRNPWRFTFDRLTADLYIGDVGQNSVEEIDFEIATSPGGTNFGWPLLEGTADFSCTDCDGDRASTTLPIHEYTHLDGNSVTGGHMYRGTQIPYLFGHYIFADVSGRVWSFAYDGSNLTQFVERTAALNPFTTPVATFGEDANGELYILYYSQGRVLKIVDPAAAASIPTSKPWGLAALAATLLLLGAAWLRPKRARTP